MTAPPITAREMEVLWLVAEGLSNKLIADQLKLSAHTVKFHLANVMKKTGTSSRTKMAVDFAIQQEQVGHKQRNLSLEGKRDWIHGFAAALAHIQRSGGGSLMISAAAKTGGLTLEAAQNAGVPFFDLSALKKARIA